MAVPDHLLESVATAVVTGGSTAVSAIVAFFHGVKKRVEELEKKVGSADTRSGLMYSIHLLDQTVLQMRHEIAGWATHPPEWLLVHLSRSRRNPSAHSFEDFGASEDRIRALESKLRDFEETLDRLSRKQKGFVTDEAFASADRQRAEDIATVRTTIAEVNGLLKGLQAALGLVKDRR